MVGLLKLFSVKTRYKKNMHLVIKLIVLSLHTRSIGINNCLLADPKMHVENNIHFFLN